ncbi:hypothetical protein PXK30_03775 [Phaeobacter gallaeciensis]|uniref:hypothetical protein n=1 Tax=Phaeobacter gallaeciensis TaxID=60890 RepID=UPI00237F0B95|nr:hypothetical protein [Phaeobacter gallaeciensis]MDE4304027.1 hypothetical protein [Phaeobacter gallaeciensis]MDE4309087.1 hypothetical protein [Phaeobacter gallaeciensis]MDE4313359.1 hypothetical protein [Phaeobacter gallaeciensis]MDE4318016.1 hypothetical protein [Phaeobacter gallaeciensis]MDE4322479.1 hypothetical protein [Phaeobacter gallaeciensis]
MTFPVIDSRTETFALTTVKTTFLTPPVGQRYMVTGVELRNKGGVNEALGTLYRTDASKADAEYHVSPKDLAVAVGDSRLARATNLAMNAADTFSGEASADGVLEVDITFYVEDVS